MNFSSCLQQNVRSKTVAVVGDRNLLGLARFLGSIDVVTRLKVPAGRGGHPTRGHCEMTLIPGKGDILPAMKARSVLVWP
jgi:hypothetical protein